MLHIYLIRQFKGKCDTFWGVTLSMCCPCGRSSEQTCLSIYPGTRRDCPWSSWNAPCCQPRVLNHMIHLAGTIVSEPHGFDCCIKSLTGVLLDLIAPISLPSSFYAVSTSPSSCSFWTLHPCCLSWMVLSWSYKTVLSHFWKVII